MGSASEAKLMSQTLAAVPERKWLPQEYFAEAASERKHSCQMMRLSELAADPSSALLRALLGAASTVNASLYYASADTADLRMRELQPSNL